MDQDEKPYLINYLRYCQEKVSTLTEGDPKNKLPQWKTALHNAYLRINQYEMQFWQKIRH